MINKKAVFADVPDYPSYKDSDAVILPVPFEKTTTYGHGTSAGPRAIIEASTNVELFDDELMQQTCDVLKIFTDKPVNTKGASTIALERIAKRTYEIASAGKFPVLLGGEHSISAAPAKALKKLYPDLSVVHFDAHADLRDTYDGTKHSHAAVMRRIVELGCKVLQVGIRSFSEEEIPLINKSPVRTIFAREIKSSRKPDPIKELKKLSKHVFITLDIDVFDPAYVPATGTPEPGGLDWYEVTEWLRASFETKKVVGMDVVELAPQKGSPSSDFLTAKLIYRALGYHSKNKK